MSDIKASPITKSQNTRLYDKIPVSKIIEKYQKDYNIDVKRFFQGDFIEVYQCQDTGFKFYYPFDVVGDDRLYEELQLRNGYYSNWNWEHETSFRLIKPTDNVLEVGCGTGSFLQRLKAENINCCGLELNNEAVKVCTQKGLKVYNELLDQHIIKNKEAYDVVCSFQVLEHVVDPASFVQGCIDAVKTGGKVIFAVPNNNPYLYKRDKFHTLNMPPHHMGLWSKEAFEALPRYFNFKTYNVCIEPLYFTKYYAKTFLEYNHFKFLGPLVDLIPGRIFNYIGFLRKWQGSHLVAIFEKK